MIPADLSWTEDPLQVTPMSYDHWKTTEPDPSPRCNANVPVRDPVPDRCEQCWRPAYGSFPGHVFCREHFLAHQRRVIEGLVAQRRSA